MKDKKFKLPPLVQVKFICNKIQKVVPFVIDESLDLYSLLTKVITYVNDMGARSNQLQYILSDLVEFCNGKLENQREYILAFLDRLYNEWQEYKASLEERYQNYVDEIDALFTQYREEIEAKYNADWEELKADNIEKYNANVALLNEKITELTEYAESIEDTIVALIETKTESLNNILDQYYNALTTSVEELKTEATNYQTSINSELTTLEETIKTLISTSEEEVLSEITTQTETITNEIDTATSEIVASLSDVNLTELLETKLDSLSQEELDELFANLYGSLIHITYMNTEEPPTVVSDVPVYHYNPDTDILTNCVTGLEVGLIPSSIYIYEGRLFIPEVNIERITTGLTNYYPIGFNVQKDKVLLTNTSFELFIWDFDNRSATQLNFDITSIITERNDVNRIVYDEDNNIIVVSDGDNLYTINSSGTTTIHMSDTTNRISSCDGLVYVATQGKIWWFNDDYITLSSANAPSDYLYLIIGKYSDYFVANNLANSISYGSSYYYLLTSDFNIHFEPGGGVTNTVNSYSNVYNGYVANYFQYGLFIPLEILFWLAGGYNPNEYQVPFLYTKGYFVCGRPNVGTKLQIGTIVDNHMYFYEVLTSSYVFYRQCAFNKYIGVSLRYDVQFTEYYQLNSKLVEISYQRSDS